MILIPITLLIIKTEKRLKELDTEIEKRLYKSK